MFLWFYDYLNFSGITCGCRMLVYFVTVSFTYLFSYFLFWMSWWGIHIPMSSMRLQIPVLLLQMFCIFISASVTWKTTNRFFFFLKKARHKLHFTARMLLANSCGISFASTKILNKERIGWLFKNKIGFFFFLDLEGTKPLTKKTPNHHKKSSMSSLCDTEEEMAASWLFNDLRVKYKLKNPVIQTSQHVSLSFVLSHPPQVPLRTGTAKALSTVKIGSHPHWGAVASA